MNKENLRLVPIILLIVLAILALPIAAFGDTVKCKETIIAITLQLCRKSPSIIIVI